MLLTFHDTSEYLEGLAGWNWSGQLGEFHPAVMFVRCDHMIKVDFTGIHNSLISNHRVEFLRWFHENLSYEFKACHGFNDTWIGFETADDAMMFKLVFG